MAKAGIQREPWEKPLQNRQVGLDSGFRQNDGSMPFTNQNKQVEPLGKAEI